MIVKHLSEPEEAALLKKIEEVKKQRGPQYKPRTKHLLADGQAKFTNRLFLEPSPYLLQHAHNPVNWYPWGEEAFEKAKELNRPVLLSIGYSTCHWCHVMEEESFENLEIAELMNQNYIAIKVDREERPDIDAVYMTAVQALTGRGGWPMTVWLTPDKKPYYGGTYFPPPHFSKLLKELKKIYDQNPEKIEEASSELARVIKQRLSSQSASDLPQTEPLHIAASYYKQAYDIKNGGLKGAPKFPSSLPIRFLLRYSHKSKDKDTLNMATQTLSKMASGGMYDHVGGGFHRYSTDSTWLVPHFEKMLYDNALLTQGYLEAYQVTRNPEFKRVAQETLDYVLRDMTSPEGGFYSATDADSIGPTGEREEGYYFTWTPAELDSILSKSEAKLVKQHYGVTKNGNFEGRNIFHTPKILKPENKTQLDSAREKLYQVRSKRPPLIRDEKILTAWNGLMISAFAKAGFVLDNPKYINAAVKSAQFLLDKSTKNKRLMRSYKDNKAHLNAYLDDYAFFIAALLDLYESTHDIKWLRQAIELDQSLEKFYEDKKSGGFFMTSHDHESLLAREKPNYDGAEPSGNSVAILNLLRLHEFTTKSSYHARAEKALKAFAGTLKRSPIALSEMLIALDFYLDTPKEIIIIALDQTSTHAFKDVLRKQFLPNRIVAITISGKDLEEQSRLIPLMKHKVIRDGRATAYVCEDRVCNFRQLIQRSLLSR
ncbi:MAG: thioredoxin domain-containing protein [Deltaproteobacteria bacterium]|nr:thioredoxin domain-containing protein [Deltaproteobacteria bacterium]